jgi:hypothetical protein
VVSGQWLVEEDTDIDIVASSKFEVKNQELRSRTLNFEPGTLNCNVK